MSTYLCSGYIAPEYARHGHFSVKSDVFSFGVLALELVSGHPAVFDKDAEYLLSYVCVKMPYFHGIFSHECST